MRWLVMRVNNSSMITQMIPSFPEELAGSITSVEDPLQTAYTIANFQRMDIKDAQEILEINSVSEKLKKLIGLLVRETEVLQIGQKIQNEARGEIEKVQREYFLREQMKAIQKEFGEKDEQAAEAEEFRKKIEEAKMPEEAEKQARHEQERLSRLPPQPLSMESSALIWIGWFRCPGQNPQKITLRLRMRAKSWIKIIMVCRMSRNVFWNFLPSANCAWIER